MACKDVIACIDLRETDMCEIVELSIIRILGEGRSVFFFRYSRTIGEFKAFSEFQLK